MYNISMVCNNSFNNIAIRKTSTLKLIIMSLITLGIYWYVWLWKLVTDVNKLYPYKGKCIHRYNWFCALIGLDIISVIMPILGIQKQFILNSADLGWLIINLALTLQLLKNIERYVFETFDIKLKHNVFGWLIFGSFYINYKINRLSKSIQHGIEYKISELKIKETIK